MRDYVSWLSIWTSIDYFLVVMGKQKEPSNTLYLGESLGISVVSIGAFSSFVGSCEALLTIEGGRVTFLGSPPLSGAGALGSIIL